MVAEEQVSLDVGYLRAAGEGVESQLTQVIRISGHDEHLKVEGP